MIDILFIQQMFFEHLLYARHHARHWGHKYDQKRQKSMPLWSFNFIKGRQIVNKLSGKIQSYAVLWNHSLSKQLLRILLLLSFSWKLRRRGTGRSTFPLGFSNTSFLYSECWWLCIIHLSPISSGFELLHGWTMFLLSLYLQCIKYGPLLEIFSFGF